MIVSSDRALTVYKKVAQVREHYKVYSLIGSSNRLSIEDFHNAVADMYQVKITKAQVSFTASHVRGMLERYDNFVKIRVRSELGHDWKRFTAVKELCHVIIDEKEDWSVDGVATIKDLLVEFSLASGAPARRQLQSEAMAEIAAIELMYPFECRLHDIARLTEGQTTEAKIAHFYGLPINMVERSLSSAFHDGVAAPLWQQVVQANAA